MNMLIKGMSFPTKENFMTQLYLICDKDGNWYAVDTTNKDLYKLIEVKEPHGDLVDRGWVRDNINHSCWIEHNDYLEAIGIIDDAPTIVEAEGENI